MCFINHQKSGLVLLRAFKSKVSSIEIVGGEAPETVLKVTN